MQACGFSSRVAHIGPLNLSPGCSFLACQQLGVRQEKNVRIALATCHRRARPQSLAHTFCDPYTRCLLPSLASPRLDLALPSLACARVLAAGMLGAGCIPCNAVSRAVRFWHESWANTATGLVATSYASRVGTSQIGWTVYLYVCAHAEVFAEAAAVATAIHRRIGSLRRTASQLSAMGGTKVMKGKGYLEST